MAALRVALLSLAALAWRASAQGCPNLCSGHGTCDSRQKCTCFPSFTGPDCSRRICDLGFRWSSKPNFTTSPHALKMECAGAGLCDGESGQCACTNGYQGAACELASCFPDATGEICGRKGKCRNMKELQKLGTVAGSVTAATTYSNWDALRMHGCYCDPGFAGPDCGQVMCKKGDNPRTKGQQRRLLKLSIDTATITGPKLRLFFAGDTSDPIDLTTLTSANCNDRLTSLDTLNAGSTVCTVSKYDAGNPTAATPLGTVLGPGQIEVLLSLVFPVRNAQNNFFAHDGSPPIDMFSCGFDESNTNTGGSSCTRSYVDTNTLTLEGAAAGSTAPQVPVGVSYTIVVSDEVTVPNKVMLTKKVAGSPDTFTYFPEASLGLTALTDTWTISGTTYTITFKLPTTFGHTLGAQWTVYSSLTNPNQVTEPGYREYDWCSGQGRCNFNEGTCTCLADAYGAACEALASENPTGTDLPAMTARAEGVDFKGTVLAVSSARPQGVSTPQFNYITVSDAGNGPFFALDGTGLLKGQSFDFNAGGNVDRGFIAQMSQGLVATYQGTPALSVYFGSTGLAPTAPMAAMTSEFPRDDPGANTYDILRVAARTSAGTSTRQPLLQVQGDGRVIVGVGPLELGGAGLAVTNGGMFINGKVSVAGPTSINGGLSVYNGVVSAYAGLATTTAFMSGVTSLIAGGATNAQFTINSGGLSVNAGGMTVSGGLTSINTGGLIVTNGGISVNTGGLTFGDATVNTGSVGEFGTTANSGGAVSVFSNAFAGSVLRLDANPAAPSYNFLAMTNGGTTSVVFTNGLVLRGSLGMAVTSEANSVGTVSLIGGAGTAGTDGAKAFVQGGTAVAGNGGIVSLSGGFATGGGGGNIFVVGGDGGSAGGNVALQAGQGVTAGTIKLQRKVSGTVSDIMTVDTSGNVAFTPTASVTTTGAVTISGNTALGGDLTLTAAGAVMKGGFFGGPGANTAIEICTSAKWQGGTGPCALATDPCTLGGAQAAASYFCAGNPTTGTKWRVYFNADTASRSIGYVGQNQLITVPYGGTFIVFS